MLEGRTQPTRAYILYTIYLFRTIFLLINYSLRDPNYICPRFFYFRDPISRLPHIRDSHFATHIRDPHSRPTFRDSTRDSHSRLTFHDSTRDSLSRLTFTTPLATPISDSHSQLHSRLTFATPAHTPNRDLLFLSRLPSCDSTTDGRTVLTPQRHLPSVTTLTLLKSFRTFSLAWPLPLATTHHHVHHP